MTFFSKFYYGTLRFHFHGQKLCTSQQTIVTDNWSKILGKNLSLLYDTASSKIIFFLAANG